MDYSYKPLALIYYNPQYQSIQKNTNNLVSKLKTLFIMHFYDLVIDMKKHN